MKFQCVLHHGVNKFNAFYWHRETFTCNNNKTKIFPTKVILYCLQRWWSVGQSFKICWTVRMEKCHWSIGACHIGAGSTKGRRMCVVFEWSIRYRVRTASYFRGVISDQAEVMGFIWYRCFLLVHSMNFVIFYSEFFCEMSLKN